MTTPLEWLAPVGSWIRSFLPELSLAIVATVLMIFGTPLLRWARSHIKRLPWLVRIGAFMAICSFGMAVMLSVGSKLVHGQLASLGNASLVLWVVIVFAVIGWLAQRERLL